jgi:hypothetical protein
MSIPKIYRLGDRHTSGILEGGVVVEEKYDGSQFSFRVDMHREPKLVCMSKNTEINPKDPGMFKQAVESATRCYDASVLQADWVYQCEFIAKPRHNVLSYARIPVNYLVLFDVRDSSGVYLDLDEKHNIALLLNLELARVFHAGPLAPTQEWLAGFLASDSSLGGCKVEGIVIKNYAKEHDERPGHPRTAKIVSDAFKEVKAKNCTPGAPGKAEQNELVERVISRYRTEGRWCKAMQHLNEQGKLTKTPKDIGPLLSELWTDLLAEEKQQLMEDLFEVFTRALRMGVAKGFPEWYLHRLEHGFNQFEQEEILRNKV